MTPQQALQFLMQMLVTKQSLSVPECAAVAQAWNTIASALKPVPQVVPQAGKVEEAEEE